MCSEQWLAWGGPPRGGDEGAGADDVVMTMKRAREAGVTAGGSQGPQKSLRLLTYQVHVGHLFGPGLKQTA